MKYSVLFFVSTCCLFSEEKLTARMSTSQFITTTEENFQLTRKCLEVRERMPIDGVWQEGFSSLGMSPSKDIDFLAQLICQGSSLNDRSEALKERSLQDSSRQFSAYISPTASFGSIDSKGPQAGFGYHTAGFMTGLDYAFDDNDERSYSTGVGGAVSYRALFGNGKEEFGDISFQRVRASGYATLVPKSIPEFGFNAIVGYGGSWDKMKRETPSGKATGKPFEKLFDLLLQAEYLISSGSYDCMPQNLSFIPLVNMQYILDFFGSYNETQGVPYNLRIKMEDPESFTTFLGARLRYLFPGDTFRASLEFDGGWQREFMDRGLYLRGQFLSFPGEDFKKRVYGVGRDTWMAGADLTLTFYEVFDLEMTSDLRWNDEFFDAFFYLGIGGTF